MAAYLPPAEGLLPKWLALVSIISIANAFQAYTTANSTQEVYNKTQTVEVSPLARRLFGTWTITSGMIRLFAAYNINEPLVYQMAMWTFAIAGLHFGSELLVFRSMQLGRANFSTFIVASGSLTWMWLQWGNYLG